MLRSCCCCCWSKNGFHAGTELWLGFGAQASLSFFFFFLFLAASLQGQRSGQFSLTTAADCRCMQAGRGRSVDWLEEDDATWDWLALFLGSAHHCAGGKTERGKKGFRRLACTMEGTNLDQRGRTRKVAGPNWASTTASCHCCCSLGVPFAARAVRG